MASGGPGGGNEPPGRGTDAAKHQQGGRPFRTDTPWVALDYSGLRHVVFPSVVPSHTSRYATSPLRSDTLPVTEGCHPSRPSCELTRRVPVGGRRWRPWPHDPGVTVPTTDRSGRHGHRFVLGISSPGDAVAQHGPAAHQQLAGQRHDRLL